MALPELSGMDPIRQPPANSPARWTGSMMLPLPRRLEAWRRQTVHPLFSDLKSSCLLLWARNQA